MRLIRSAARVTILCAGVIALAIAPSRAANVVVNHVYDPSHVLPASILGEALATPVTLGVGDTLDMTITFTGGAIAHFTGEDGLWPLLLTQTGPDATLNVSATMEFLGASPNVVSGPIPLDQDNSFVHVGVFYSSGLYRLDANPISFSGLRQIITINSDDIGVEREYQRIALTFFSGSVRFTPGAVVPEPATWAMTLSGLVLVAGVRLRRRKR
jgi:hypothetical protein